MQGVPYGLVQRDCTCWLRLATCHELLLAFTCCRWEQAHYPNGEWHDDILQDAVVLHYAYSYRSDVASKAHRSCPDTYLEAARSGNKTAVRIQCTTALQVAIISCTSECTGRRSVHAAAAESSTLLAYR